MAAAAWGLALGAVGLGVVTSGPPGDGTHYALCPRGTKLPPPTASVTLTEQFDGPVLHVRVGESFTVGVDGISSPVVEPRVTRKNVICQATRSAPAVHLAVIFLATHEGTTRLLSSFRASTGGAAGVNAGAFAASVVVTPRR